jgi:hypothetical protein
LYIIFVYLCTAFLKKEKSRGKSRGKRAGDKKRVIIKEKENE